MTLNSNGPIILSTRTLAGVATNPIIVAPRRNRFTQLKFALKRSQVTTIQSTTTRLNIIILLGNSIAIITAPSNRIFVGARDDPGLTTTKDNSILSKLLNNVLTQRFIKARPSLQRVTRVTTSTTLIRKRTNELTLFPTADISVTSGITRTIT